MPLLLGLRQWRDWHLHGIWRRQLSDTEQIKVSLSATRESLRDRYDYLPAPGVVVDFSGVGRRLDAEVQHQRTLLPDLRLVWGLGLLFVVLPVWALLQRGLWTSDGAWLGLSLFAQYLETPALLDSAWRSLRLSALQDINSALALVGGGAVAGGTRQPVPQAKNRPAALSRAPFGCLRLRWQGTLPQQKRLLRPGAFLTWSVNARISCQPPSCG